MLKLFIILLVLFFLARAFFRGLFAPIRRQAESLHRQQSGFVDEKKPTGSLEVLSSCPKCGTYFSDKQKIVKAGRAYCSQDCAR